MDDNGWGRGTNRLQALFFDLDETLIAEEHAVARAFRATAQLATLRIAVEVDEFALLARRAAKDLWKDLPIYDHCQEVGISSEEGLWARFDGAAPDNGWLRHWSRRFRHEVWQTALAEAGATDAALARRLDTCFGQERRARCQALPGALQTLRVLAQRFRLGIVTNGPACLQRDKLRTSGLDRLFSCVVISGEIGIGKPDRAIFEHAARGLDADLAASLMIGDNLDRDIRGATDAGLLGAVAMRAGRTHVDHLWAVDHLDELPELIGAINCGAAVRDSP